MYSACAGYSAAGEDDDGSYDDGISVDPTTGLLLDTGGLLGGGVLPVTTPITSTIDLSNLPTTTPLDLSDINQLLLDNAALSPAQIANVAASSGGTLSAAQIAQIIGSSTNAAVSVYKATSSPSLVAGTGLVYNPATGQLVSGTTGAQVASSIASSLSSILPLLLVVGAAVLILPMLKGGK